MSDFTVLIPFMAPVLDSAVMFWFSRVLQRRDYRWAERQIAEDRRRFAREAGESSDV